MQRDLNAIELPPPQPDYGKPTGDDVIDDVEEAGRHPIDDLSMGTDPSHLGANDDDTNEETEPGRAGVDWRGPVQAPPDRDDPEAMARSRDAKASHGDANPSETQTEGMPVDHRDRPVDRDPSA